MLKYILKKYIYNFIWKIPVLYSYFQNVRNLALKWHVLKFLIVCVIAFIIHLHLLAAYMILTMSFHSKRYIEQRFNCVIKNSSAINILLNSFK